MTGELFLTARDFINMFMVEFLVLFPIILSLYALTSLPPSVVPQNKSKTIKGRPYRHEIHQEWYKLWRKHKRTLRVMIAAEKQFFFVLTRQDKKVRSEEYQTGDSDFDNNFYITSDDAHFHQILQQSSQFRAAASQFLTLEYTDEKGWGRASFDSLNSRFGRLWVNYTLESGVPEAKIADIVQTSANLLEQCNDELAQHPAQSIAIQRDPFIWRTKLFKAVAWSFALAIVFGLVNELPRESFVIDMSTVQRWSFRATIPLAILLYGVIYAQFRTSPRLKQMRVFLLLFAVGIYLGMAAGIEWYNTTDNTEAIAYHTTIIDQRITYRRRRGLSLGSRERKPNGYYVYVPDWVGTREIKWSVAKEQYEALEIGQPITLYWHPGRLGVRWVEKIDY